MSPTSRRREHNPRACRLLRRPGIRHALLRVAAAKFRTMLDEETFGPLFELRRLLDREKRATRSDLREGIALTMSCALLRMDLRSQCVGWRNSNAGRWRKRDFVGLSRQRYATWSGCSERSSTRYLTLLRRAGLLAGPGRDGVNVIPQPVEEREDGSTRGLPAVRRVTDLFFSALHLDGWLAKLKQQAVAATKPPSDQLDRTTARIAAARIVRALGNRHALDGPTGPPG